ncbi:MAG: acetolactate synthase [Planctomycetota bacterium]|nr:MAG: acetolactate synthase [Planctomycetota bacterium]
MPGEFGDDAHIDAQTMRGHDWPCLHQFCVFMPNRVGKLHDLLRKLERQDLRVASLSVVDSVDFAVARLIVDHVDHAREILNLGGHTFTEVDIIGVQLPESSQPFTEILQTLMRAEINVHYIYSIPQVRSGRRAAALHVDNIDQSIAILKQQGVELLTEDDLKFDADFF